MIATLLLAGLAGLLSTLSPCVLPILPIVLGAAASEHRWGPVALAGGVAISFATLGLLVAVVGASLGLNSDVFRIGSAVLLVAIGAVLIVARWQQAFAVTAAPLGRWVEERLGGASTKGLAGQFVLGLLLGAVWSPCVGPTLGAASVAASRLDDLGSVAATMLVFGIGAALPLLALGMLSRQAMMRARDSMRSASGLLKPALGVALVAAGLLIVTGLDKRAEAVLVEVSPDWLINLTTQF